MKAQKYPVNVELSHPRCCAPAQGTEAHTELAFPLLHLTGQFSGLDFRSESLQALLAACHQTIRRHSLPALAQPGKRGDPLVLSRRKPDTPPTVSIFTFPRPQEELAAGARGTLDRCDRWLS